MSLRAINISNLPFVLYLYDRALLVVQSVPSHHFRRNPPRFRQPYFFMTLHFDFTSLCDSPNKTLRLMSHTARHFIL